MESKKIYLLTSGNIHELTGGYLYNQRLAAGLSQKGHTVKVISLAETPSDQSVLENALRRQLRQTEPGSCVVIDSIVLGMMNRVIKEHGNRYYFVGLVHLPATLDLHKTDKEMELAENELESMNALNQLVVTGNYIKQLLEQAGLDGSKISIIEPGVDNFPRKRDYAGLPFELLCISNFSWIKGQMLLADALSRLTNRNWTLRMYGNMSAGKEYVDSLKKLIASRNLGGRIQLHDTLNREDISSAFLKADLFVLPTQFESFGMVLTESLAHGIPVVTTTAGNLVHTVPAGMGILTEPGNVDELSFVLNRLFTDRNAYGSLCRSAALYYMMARSWEATVAEFEEILR